MDKYPFTRCLQPRRIINPYTRESLVVECGRCPACQLRKSSVNAMKVKLESLSHKYKMFVTLTYSNLYLPTMVVKATNRYLDDCNEVQDTREPFALIDTTARLGTEGTILGYTSNYYWCTEVLSKKCETVKTVLPHLSKYDAQLFIKRLRRNLDKYYLKYYGTKAPKIRYYLVGEYGPVHFRPHYHVELWFEEDEIYKVIRQILYKSWPYGRIDCQKSLGKCSDYLAKYLNSDCALPSVFKGGSVRPFAIHSAHLGEKVFEATRQEIYENDFERVVSRSIPYFSTDSDVTMWRSLKAYYFPKCKGYSQKSEHERLYSYSTYVNAYRWTGETNVAAQARTIVTYILYRFYKIDIGDVIYHIDDKLLDYFEKSSLFDPTSFEKKKFNEHIDDVYRRVYMELRTSKHFHRFVCKGFLNNYKPMLNKIDKFWSDDDMKNLSNQLTAETEFAMSDWFEDEEDFQFFYYNRGFVLEKFKKTKAYKCFDSVTTKNSANAIKHKELNDKNRIFCDK